MYTAVQFIVYQTRQPRLYQLQVHRIQPQLTSHELIVDVGLWCVSTR